MAFWGSDWGFGSVSGSDCNRGGVRRPPPEPGLSQKVNPQGGTGGQFGWLASKPTSWGGNRGSVFGPVFGPIVNPHTCSMRSEGLIRKVTFLATFAIGGRSGPENDQKGQKSDFFVNSDLESSIRRKNGQKCHFSSRFRYYWLFDCISVRLQ